MFHLWLFKPVLQCIHFVFIINTRPLFLPKGKECLLFVMWLKANMKDQTIRSFSENWLLLLIDTKNFSYNLLKSNLKLVKYRSQFLRMNSSRLKVAFVHCSYTIHFLVLRFSRYQKKKNTFVLAEEPCKEIKGKKTMLRQRYIYFFVPIEW